jgi:hypothetical protein
MFYGYETAIVPGTYVPKKHIYATKREYISQTVHGVNIIMKNLMFFLVQ